MDNTQYSPALEAVEVRHLYYFSVVAEEGSLRRAAERLFMAQPPLSRHMAQLEQRLGVALFVRHSKGLSLTEEGKKTLRIIQPLLQEQKRVFAQLRTELQPQGLTLRLGLSTAFEQGVFARLEALLHKQYGKGLYVRRAGSPKLVQDIRHGRLDAALVALPLEAPGLLLQETPYAEPLQVALPAQWAETEAAYPENTVTLAHFTGKNLFWFQREKHPAFFDYTKALFMRFRFTPHYIEEPVEHDVLLARIAAGEGMGLFAASFASITRNGVVFAPLVEENRIELRLGIATPHNSPLGEALLAQIMTVGMTP